MLRGYLHEIWFCPDGSGNLLPACLPFGPDGDAARALNEPGSRCVYIFWANSHYEAMCIFYAFVDYGNYSTEFSADFEHYPHEWLQAQSEYINAL